MSDSAPDSLVRVEGLSVSYGSVAALFDVSLRLDAGHTLAVLGANGAGKSTLASAIAGLVGPSAGKVWFAGEDVTGYSAHRRAVAGIAFVPEGRAVFPGLSVIDNLRMGIRRTVAREERSAALQRAFDQFPRLGERRGQLVGSLSGGEQQMVALARVLACSPRVLIADEPSLGLAPTVIDAVFDSLDRIRSDGTTILLIEQYVERSLEFADQAVILRQGRLVWRGPASQAAARAAIEYIGAEEVAAP